MIPINEGNDFFSCSFFSFSFQTKKLLLMKLGKKILYECRDPFRDNVFHCIFENYIIEYCAYIISVYRIFWTFYVNVGQLDDWGRRKWFSDFINGA